MNPDDELYTAPPGAFVAARNMLVKELRRKGRREEADRVARLRRPTATAWALNQVAREDPGAVRAVLDAGGALRAAMGEAVAGAGDALRRGQAAERAALRSAVDGALGRLRGAGLPAADAARQRLMTTLRAAMVDDEVATRLRSGTLEIDYEAPGFGISDVVSAPVRPASLTPDPPPDADARARKRQADAELRRLEAAAEVVAKRAERLAHAAREAEATARSAAAAAAAADAEAQEAAARVAEARERAVD